MLRVPQSVGVGAKNIIVTIEVILAVKTGDATKRDHQMYCLTQQRPVSVRKTDYWSYKDLGPDQKNTFLFEISLNFYFFTQTLGQSCVK